MCKVLIIISLRITGLGRIAGRLGAHRERAMAHREQAWGASLAGLGRIANVLGHIANRLGAHCWQTWGASPFFGRDA